MIGAAEQRKMPVVIEVQSVTVITSNTHKPYPYPWGGASVSKIKF